MSDASDTVDGPVGETSLLDLLVVLAENLKLLIAGPLVAGACALGLSFVWPQSYDSVAILQADASIASLMTTAAVLDPVVESLGLGKDESPGAARDRLRAQIKASVGRTDKLLTLAVSARTAEQARAMATAVLEQTYVQSKPKGIEGARLEAQLATVRERAKIADAAIAALGKQLTASSPSSATSLGEVARGYAELLSAQATALAKAAELSKALEGLSPSQLVQPPTLAIKPSRPKKTLVAVGTALATGVLLLLFVWARQALRSSADDAETAQKLARLRRALGMKPAD